LQIDHTTPQKTDQPSFLTLLAANLRIHQLWTHGSPAQPRVIVVGVSGGADSVALLHGLARLAAQDAKTRHWRLHVAHLDHSLRAGSALDAAFVEEQAAALGFPFHGSALAPGALNGGNLEQAARHARYEFLTRVALNVTPAGQVPIIVTAHHADDQAETLLLHLLRGAGLDGLGGMRWVTELNANSLAPSSGDARAVRLVRPLLNVLRVEIMAWLEAQQLEWRRDESNEDTHLIRNRLRRVIMPQLQAINPQLVSTLSRTAEVLAGDAERLRRLDREQLVALIVDPTATNLCAERVVLDAAGFGALDAASQRGLLRAALDILLPDLRDVTFERVESLRRRLAWNPATGGPHPLFRGVAWTLAAADCDSPQRLSLHRMDALPFAPISPHLGATWRPTPLQIPGQLQQGDWRLTGRVIDIQALPRDWRDATQPWRAFLDVDRAGSPLLATPASQPPGVRFAPLGMAGRHKHLGDFFTDHKVPVALRPGWPLVVERAMGEIFWVCGLQVGHAARISATTGRVLVLTWERE